MFNGSAFLIKIQLLILVACGNSTHIRQKHRRQRKSFCNESDSDSHTSQTKQAWGSEHWGGSSPALRCASATETKNQPNLFF